MKPAETVRARHDDADWYAGWRMDRTVETKIIDIVRMVSPTCRGYPMTMRVRRQPCDNLPAPVASQANAPIRRIMMGQGV